MNRRLIYLIICIVVLAQIISYALIQKKNTRLVYQEVSRLENDIRGLNAREAQLQRQISLVADILKNTPPTLLAGFEDPEKGFAEFLDYLNNPVVEELQVRIGLLEKQKYQTRPVALHQTRFSFEFNFRNTYEAERFFNFLLHQNQYPVQVEDMKITRTGGKSKSTEVKLDVVLYIPAKLQLPSNI